jgi:Fic family protein
VPGHYESRIWPSDPTRDAPLRHRRACRYEVHLPAPLRTLQLTLDGQLAALVSEAEHALHGLNRDGGGALRPLARLLLRTESIASSKVEGMQLGVRELALAEAKRAYGTEPGPTARDVLGNIDAMQIALDSAVAEARFDTPQIQAIHRRLLEGTTHGRIAGAIRTRQNWIGGNDYTPCDADFVPPPPETLQALLVDLCDALNDHQLSPLVHAALIHAQFETIHPFVDGNGRTGRALVHVVLRRRGLTPHFVPPISVVFADARDTYVAALMRYREPGETGLMAWIEHFAAATLRAARLARVYMESVQMLQRDWRARMRTQPAVPRADAAVWSLIDMLPAYPVLTAADAIADTGRSKSRVYDAIDQLVAAGVLAPISGRPRYQAWEALGLLELITELEQGRLGTTA